MKFRDSVNSVLINNGRQIVDGWGGEPQYANKTRTNWPRKVRELILDSDSWAQGVKGYAFWVPGGQRVGFHGRRGSRGRPTGSQGVKR